MKKSKADIICDKFHEKHKNSKEYLKDSDWKVTLSRLEFEEMRLWMNEHEKTCSIKKKHKKLEKQGHHPAGGWCNYTVEITGTGLGNVIVIKCECGKKRDITHAERW